MIVGTAGHIDHGKTSLVRALTGVDTDRLPQEKARGITLDLGFAYVPLPGGGVLGFVDVPGHERLVHTMIAGAASIGMALLVVAADDGVMPQTREHLQILSLLGVSRGVVALTKTDLVDADRAVEVELDIAALLDDTPLAGADIFPVSTITGAGVGALRDRLLVEAAGFAAAEPQGRQFRLAIDRSFSMAGAGTVVTGSIVAGVVRTGDSVLLLPYGMRARVRGMHAANLTVDQAIAGERCALNLTGPGVRKDAIRRGDWVMDPAGDAMTRRCDVSLRALGPPLKDGTQVLLHHGAGQVSARVIVLTEGLAHLVLAGELPLRHGDRLVLRDAGASRTIAGGRVLDPRPPARHRRRPQRLAALQALASDGIAGRLSEPPFLVSRAALLADFGLTETGIPPGLLSLDGFVATEAGVAALSGQVASALAGFHARQPAAPGMTAEALRLALPMRLPRDAFVALTAYLLAARSVAAEAHLLRATDHHAGLPGDEAQLWERLQPVLGAVPFRPPLLHEVAAALDLSDVRLRRSCKNLARLGLVVEMAPDRFFLRDAAIGMAEAAHTASAAAADGWFTAATFRDEVACGRQLAIQVLDYLDRRGVTQRRGDLRRAGKAVRAVFGG